MTVNENEAGQGPNAVVTQPTAAEAAEAARLAAVQVAAQAGGPVRAYQPISFERSCGGEEVNIRRHRQYRNP